MILNNKYVAKVMRLTVLIIFSFLLVSLTPLADVAKADNTFSSAIEVTDGYDDYWWVCYDDDCSEGPGTDQLDIYKLKVYDGDKVTWEIYNRADPHYVWLGVTFYNSDGSVIDLPADECSTCSDDDMMWVGDYETDSMGISYYNVASSGDYVYARVHAHDGNGGDGTWYDIRVDVDTSGRTSSSGNDNSDDQFTCDDGEQIPASWENDGEEDCEDGSDENNSGSSNSGGSCTSASSCPYQSGKTATCYSGACLYIDNPSFPPDRTDSSSSDVEIPGKLLAYAIIIPILFVIGVISRVSKRRSRKSQNVDLTTSFEPITPNYDFDEYTAPSQTMYSSYNQNTIPLAQSINPYNPIPIQPNEGLTSAEQSYPNQNIPPSGPPSAVPSKPRNSLTGEFDDAGYEWLKWNANGLWYWRSGDYAEWTEFNQ